MRRAIVLRLAALPLLLVVGACSAADPDVEAAARPEPPQAEASACRRLDGAAASAAPGLQPMGTAGPHALYGEPRRMLCSEPGAGGEGECELVAPTTVRITRGAQSWGYRAEADSILRYGPAAVTCAPAAARTAPSPSASAAPDAFYGSWIVAEIQGGPTPPGQSAIRLDIDSGRMFARADCAHLGQLSYAAEGATLRIGAPPRHLVTSCARGLSQYEGAFTAVFAPGAVSRLDDGVLLIESPAGAIRATRIASSPEITLPLLPVSEAGDAAVLFGVLEVQGRCLYVRTAGTGERVMPALMQARAVRDPRTGVFHIGRAALVPGSEVSLGGSMRTGSAPLAWRQAPDPACDQSRIWITAAIDESPPPPY